MSTDVLDVSRRSHSHRAGLHPPASKSPPSLRTFANIRRCDSLPTQSPQIRHPPLARTRAPARTCRCQLCQLPRAARTVAV